MHRPLARSLTFTLPPMPRALSPNGTTGRGWRASLPAKKSYREEACRIATDAKAEFEWPGPRKVRVHLVFGTKAKGLMAAQRGVKSRDRPYRPADIPNALSAFKAGFDGIVDAGIAPDDTHVWMKLGVLDIDPNREPGVWVRIEEEL